MTPVLRKMRNGKGSIYPNAALEGPQGPWEGPREHIAVQDAKGGGEPSTPMQHQRGPTDPPRGPLTLDGGPKTLVQRKMQRGRGLKDPRGT